MSLRFSKSVTFHDYNGKENNEEEEEQIGQLNAQLTVVDTTIKKILTRTSYGSKPSAINEKSTRREKTSLPSKVYRGDRDVSNIIDTQSLQLATCPNCQEEMDSKKMKIHSCNNRQIICPEFGCGCTLRAKELRRHLNEDCVVAKKRMAILDQRKKREEEEAAARLREYIAQQQREREELEARNKQLRSSKYHRDDDDYDDDDDYLFNKSVNNIGTEDSIGEINEDRTMHIVSCADCGETMKTSQLTMHCREKCFKRKVLCPNRQFGCTDTTGIPLDELEDHLHRECKAIMWREELISKSKLRKEPIQCILCGEMCPMEDMRSHELEECPNRKVHCRNYHLGCNVMVKLSERALHEIVTAKQATRQCLYFTGLSSHMALAEDDINSPWTMEAWIYRPPIKESAKSYLRCMLMYLAEYNLAYAAECLVKSQVLEIVNALKSDDSSSTSSSALTASLRSERVDMLNQLTALVSSYSDAVLSYTKALQSVSICVEAAMANIKEIMAEIGYRDSDTAENLNITYPGKKSQSEFTLPSFMQGKGSAVVSELEAVAVSPSLSSHLPSASNSLHSKISGISHHSNKNTSKHNSKAKNSVTAKKKQNKVQKKKTKASDGSKFPEHGGEKGDETDLDEEEDDDGNEDGKLETTEALQDTELFKEDGDDYGNGMEEGNEEDNGQEEEKEGGKDEEDNLTSKPLSTVNFEALKGYLNAGNYVSAIFRKCIQLENPATYTAFANYITQQIRDVAFGVGYEEPASAAFEVEGQVDPEVSAKRKKFGRLMEQFENNIFILKEKPRDEKKDTFYLSDRDLQEFGISKVVHDFMFKPSKIISGDTKMRWSGWLELVELIDFALKIDLATLQGWRLEAGLVQFSESAAEGEGKSNLTEEQERALKKKEQERRRRENKKNKQQKPKETIDGDNVDDNDVEGKAKPLKKAVDKGTLKKRVTDLLRGGCSGDVFAESSFSLGGKRIVFDGTNVEDDETMRERELEQVTLTEEGGTGHRRSRLCLCMYSGLQVLEVPSSPEIEEQELSNPMDRLFAMANNNVLNMEHIQVLRKKRLLLFTYIRKMGVLNYNTLIRSGDADQLRECKGQVVAVLCGKSGGDNASGAVTIEVKSFEAEVPRSKWTHVAIVASDQQNSNRLTLYLDGDIMKSLKQSSFPMPMASLCGSGNGSSVNGGVPVYSSCRNNSTLLSFEGAVLDLRLWCKQRSATHIKDSMHRLLTLTEQQYLQLPADGAKAATKGSLPPKNKKGDPNEALTDKGLVAWWTFEDGPSSDLADIRVDDITGKRFKTLVQRGIDNRGIVPKRMPSRDIDNKTTTKKSGAKKKAAVEYAFSHYDIADEILNGISFLILSQPNLFPPPIEDVDNAETDDNAIFGNNKSEELVIAPNTPAANATTNAAANELYGVYRFLYEINQHMLKAVEMVTWLDADTLPQKSPSVGNNKTNGKTDKEKEREDDRGGVGTALEAAADDVDNISIGSKSASKSSLASMMKSMLPLPSFRQRHQCPFEIRRNRLAKSGRDLQRDTPCPAECGIVLRGLDVRFHVRFECVRRIVTCRFDYCMATFPLLERESHERSSDCAVVAGRESVFVKAEGRNEATNCPNCSEFIKKKDLEHHILHECPHRKVSCPRVSLGCSVTEIPANELDHHLKYDCESKPWNERLVLVERARQRQNYPRPWGIIFQPFDSSNNTTTNNNNTATNSITSTSSNDRSHTHIDFDDEII